jgi:hypothetical protein
MGTDHGEALDQDDDEGSIVATLTSRLRALGPLVWVFVFLGEDSPGVLGILFHPFFLFFDEHLNIQRGGANRTDVLPCRLVEIGFAHLLAVRTSHNERFIGL